MSITKEELEKYAKVFGYDEEVVKTAAQVYDLPREEFEETLIAVRRSKLTLQRLRLVSTAFMRREELIGSVDEAAHMVDHVIWHILTQMLKEVWSVAFNLKEGKVRVVYEIPEGIDLEKSLRIIRENTNRILNSGKESRIVYNQGSKLSYKDLQRMCSHPSYLDFLKRIAVRQVFPKLRYSEKAHSQINEKAYFLIDFLVIGNIGKPIYEIVPDPDYVCCPHVGDIATLKEVRRHFDVEIASLRRKGCGRKGMQKVEIRFSVWVKDKYGFSLKPTSDYYEKKEISNILDHMS